MVKRGQAVRRRPVKGHKASTVRKQAPTEVNAKRDNLRLAHELAEAREQQAATSELLKVIGRSTYDLQPVFETLAENAVRLCEAERSFIFRFDGEYLRVVATYNTSAEIRAFVEQNPILPGRASATARAALEQRTVHVLDAQTDPEYTYGSRQVEPFRTILTVPMLKANQMLGVILVYRLEVRPFTNSQIALLETFADQAVIAIENVRLFDEVQSRTEDLRESLQQQTATADVLKTISRSSVDLETVLDTLVETVARLCRADQAAMFRWRDDKYHLVAAHGLSAEAKKFMITHPFAPDRGLLSGRVVLERRAVHIPDVLQDSEYTYLEGQKVVGYRTLLGIPLLREETLIGTISVYRQVVRPFTDKEIELATSFADQAVIAIENARLFDELRDRQAELRVTFDNMGDGVVMFDAEARLTAWNRNFQEMLELPDAFLAGRPSFADYFRYLADRGEYSADLEAQLSRTIEDTRREMRVERTRPDGQVIEMRRNPVPGGGFVLYLCGHYESASVPKKPFASREMQPKRPPRLRIAQASLVHAQKMAALDK